MKDFLQIFKAFGYTCQGLWAGLKERAFRQEAIVFVISLPLIILIPCDPVYKLILILLYLLSMSVELLNTAIEKIADLVSPDFHLLVKLAKDMGSAAVFLVFTAGFTAWGFAIYSAWPVWFPK